MKSRKEPARGPKLEIRPLEASAIGERIRFLREGQGLSQGDIEMATGLLMCYTSRVEHGHTLPSLETLERFAAALGVPLYMLFCTGGESVLAHGGRSTGPGAQSAPKRGKGKGEEALTAYMRALLSRDAEAHREELKKRFDSLEAFVRQEAESLEQRLKAEKSERLEALKELSREVRDSEKALEKKLAQSEDAMAKGTTELRARILEQSKSLSAEIGEKHRELSSVIDRDVQALRADKADREALADLFTEVALRPKKGFALPEAK